MNLFKPQVKALLDVMSSDDVRPALCQLWTQKIEGKTYAIATDSYHAVCLQVPDDFDNKVVTRSDLTRFYKLMERKDALTPDTMRDLLTEVEHTPPKFEQILEKTPKEGNTERICFNAKYATTLEKLAGQPLCYRMTGKMDPMIANVSDDIYILMPVKI